MKIKFGENENDIDVIASNINNKKIRDKKCNFCIVIYVSRERIAEYYCDKSGNL